MKLHDCIQHHTVVKGDLAGTGVFRKCHRMLLVVVAVASPFIANSQPSFGIKAGVNASHLVEEKVDGDFSMALNYHAGVPVCQWYS